MKRLAISILVFVICSVLFGCPGIDPINPPITTTTSHPTTTSSVAMECEIYDGTDCSDGSYIEICLAYDLSQCGYRVKGQWFSCARCTPYVDCDDAARGALYVCWSDEFRIMEVDEAEFLVGKIDEVVNNLVEQLEEMK